MKPFQPSSLYMPGASSEQRSSLDELLISKSRALVLLTAVFFLFSIIVISGAATTAVISRLFGLGIGFGLLSYAAYRWMETRFLLAHILWQAGLALIPLASGAVLNQPEVLLLLALLPLVAAITLSFWAGVIAEGVLIAIIAWVQSAASPLQLPAAYTLVIPFFGAFGGLLGWITTNHLMTTAAWALFSFQQAQSHLNEAREQRVELKQTQEDLVQAFQELARMTERLKSLQRIAEEARQAKADFVANVSHELRTPLNMIIGFTEVITRSPGLYGGRLPAALMTDITAIQRNSRHLLNLVNDVLDLSQVEGGRMALSRDWTDINALVGEAVAIVESLFQSKGLYLEVEAGAGLPDVYCDRTRIRQVIINILSNAGRFTRTGGVNVRTWAASDQLHISIRDTGPGIPAEHQQRIFEPFQQMDNSIRRQYGGSGLGLTISKQFIEMHDGQMGLESQPGQGTTFFFSLPLTPSLGAEGAPAGQTVRRSLIPGDETGYRLRTRPSRAAVPHPAPRLVIYEREQSLQRIFSRYLSETEIVAAQTLEEAVAAISRSPAQAVIVNAPPHENAPAAILAAAPVGTPVIACWLPGEVEAASQLGVIQYLMKPITREKLLSAVEQTCAVEQPAALETVEHPGEQPTPALNPDGARTDGIHTDSIPTILVVDDEPDELHLFARMLESAPQGYRVLQVTNGKRALEVMRSRPVDLVLLDLIMPVMDGFQVLEARRQEPALSAIPVIVISSRDPLGEAITSNTIQISHNGGFSTTHLLEVIQTMTEIILPESEGKGG